jgi:molybdenum cofactor biosynthesis enzyme MoaA
LRDKAAVKRFIKENAGLLKKIGTAEIFVGSASNQQMPEYRSLCEDYREIDYRVVIENIERELKGSYGIFISGGEPLIRKDIFSILEKAPALGARKLALKTNARMLAYDDFCSRMAGVVDEIMVFVPDDSVSQVKGSQEQSRKGIDNWRKAGKKAVSYSRIC